MRLTVLGAGPAYTNREGSTGACYLVEQDGTHLLLDLGQGSFPRIFRHVAPEDVDAVVISHLHPDHFIDLVPMRHYLRYYLEPRRSIRVVGPSDLAARLDSPPRPAGVHRRGVAGVDAGHGTPPDRELRGHGGPRAAHRRELRDPGGAGAGGPGLVYSGDCGRADDLVPLVRPGDVLLAEASFGPGPVPAGRPAPRRAGGRAAGDGDPGRSRPAHPPPDGPRPGRDDRVLPRRLRRTGRPGLARRPVRPLSRRRKLPDGHTPAGAADGSAKPRPSVAMGTANRFRPAACPPACRLAAWPPGPRARTRQDQERDRQAAVRRGHDGTGVRRRRRELGASVRARAAAAAASAGRRRRRTSGRRRSCRRTGPWRRAWAWARSTWGGRPSGGRRVGGQGSGDDGRHGGATAVATERISERMSRPAARRSPVD